VLQRHTCADCCATEFGAVRVDEGLKHDSVINCDQITRLEKSMLTDYIGALSLAKLKQLRSVLVVAFDIDDDPDADILDLT
jgi:mRNA interferase MazF